MPMVSVRATGILESEREKYRGNQEERNAVDRTGFGGMVLVLFHYWCLKATVGSYARGYEGPITK